MKREIAVKLIFILIDICIINFAFVFSFYLRFSSDIPDFNISPYYRLWYINTLIFILVFYFSGLYRREEYSISYTFDLFYAVAFSYLIIIMIYYIFRARIGGFPSSVFSISWLLNVFLLSFVKAVLLRLFFKKTIVILGHEKSAEIIESRIQGRRYRYKGYIDLKEKKEKIIDIIIEKKIRIIVIADSSLPASKLYFILDKLFGLGVRILLDMKIKEIPPLSKTRIYHIKDLVLNELLWGKKDILYLFVKRSMDFFLSLLLLILLTPLFIIVMILIKTDSKGTIFYIQERIGKENKKFTMYKFRTMVPDAEKKIGPVWSKKQDTRITRLGAVLRKYRIDELPQLWNILKGEMSFVGPRPERSYFINKYPVLLGRRLSVKPGLTGLAQVNSLDLNPEMKTQYDIAYVENPSLLLDFTIIQKTFILLFKRMFNE